MPAISCCFITVSTAAHAASASWMGTAPTRAAMRQGRRPAGSGGTRRTGAWRTPGKQRKQAGGARRRRPACRRAPARTQDGSAAAPILVLTLNSRTRNIWLSCHGRSKHPQKRLAPARPRGGADGATAPETLRQTGLRGVDDLERRIARPPKEPGTRRAKLSGTGTDGCSGRPTVATPSGAIMPRIAIIGAGITGVTSAVLRKQVTTFPSTTASAIPRWKPPTPTAASCRPATPRSGTAPPPCSGSALAGPQQRAAAAQSALQLAQVFLAAAIHAPDPQPPPQHHRHHPAGDRGAPAPVRHGRGRRHRLRPGAARHPAHLPRRRQLRGRATRQRAAARRRPGTLRGHARGGSRHRAGAANGLPRRLHAVRRHRRHPQVHARAGPGLRATGRALRAGRRRRRDRGRRRGLR